MKIRRYMAKNTQEALLKVKLDLGSNAVILSTRKVRKKGLKNLFSIPMYEVTAAIDDYALNEANESKKAEISNEHKIDSTRIGNLEKKVNSMEQLLQKIHDQLFGAGDNSAPEAVKSARSNLQQLFYNNLVRNEVEPSNAEKILAKVQEKLGQNSNVNETAAELYSIIAGMLGKPETLKLREDGKPTAVVFFGPTGVGKTTTIAKVAANYLLNHKKSVGLITSDTYRIAAVEQLKTYAEILGIPLNVIYSPADMKAAIDGYADKDIILIDTAGRNHRNKSQFSELQALYEAVDYDEVFLLLSAATNMKTCKEILEAYSFLKDYKLIFTKADEAMLNGMILNTRLLTNKSISYITTGQSVPDDIEIANIEKIIKNMMGSIA